MLDASLGVNYRIRAGRDDEGEVGGFLVGLQGGYTFAVGDPSWELDGLNDVAGGPDLGVEGLHLRLSIGGWGRRESDR